MEKGNKIKLVLSGGGMPGILSHTGAILELVDQGFIIEEIGGVSAGAVVAAAYASGLNLETEILSLMVKHLHIGLSYQFVEAFDGRPYLLSNNAHTILQAKLPKLMKEVKIPLHIVTANLATERQMIWCSRTHPDWKLADIVYASMALPFIFEPQKLGEWVHVDGGVTSNVPADDIFGDHEDVLVLRIEREDKTPHNPTSIVEFAEAFLNTMIKGNQYEDIADVSLATIIPVRTFGSTLRPLVTEKYAKSVIELGRQSIKDWLSNG